MPRLSRGHTPHVTRVARDPVRFHLGLLLAGMLLAGAPPATAGPIEQTIDRALSTLDTSQLRTGILYDRVLPMSGIERFDGTSHAPVADAGVWRQMVAELRRSATAPSGIPADAALEARAAAAGPERAIPIGLIDRAYERLRPDALLTGSIRVEGDRVTIGVGDPFQSARAFAAAALVGATYYGADVAFALDPALLVRDPAAPDARYEVDLADGAGWRALAPGTPVRAHYGTTGTRVLRLRATDVTGTREAAFSFAIQALTTPAPTDTLRITATTPYLGAYGTALAYEWLAPGHTHAVNPLVVTDGFDLDNSKHWEGIFALIDQQGVADSLHALGFDVIVLDYTDATDYIQRNAFAVVELLRRIQAGMPPSATMAVVGPSMGALCTRYALAWMELHGIPHRVRLWMSFDGPHGGAVVPIGLQYWLSFFAQQSSAAAQLRDVLDRPASRQLLLQHLTQPPGPAAPDPLRAAFLADLAGLGNWPSGLRRVALANGSGARVNQGFLPADQIVKWEYSSFLVSVKGDVWAAPGPPSHVVFDGHMRAVINSSDERVTLANTATWDGAPGGWRASMAEMDAVHVPYGNIVALHPNHCFVPTVSALALATPDPLYDVAGDTNLMEHTPFDAVHWASTNESHVSMNAGEAAWVLHELERGVVTVPDDVAAASGPVSFAEPAPNPARDVTRFAFTLPAAAAVRLRIYDVDGRARAVLAEGTLAAGSYERAWDGRDAAGHGVAPGLYFARLETAGAVEVRRIVRLK